MNTERGKEIMLMALRCEYLEGPELTAKGLGDKTPEQWREENKQKCLNDPQWKKTRWLFLRDI